MDNKEIQDKWDQLVSDLAIDFDNTTMSSSYYDPDPWAPSLTTASITAAGTSSILGPYGSNAVPNGGYITTGSPLYTNGTVDTLTLSNTIWDNTISNSSGQLNLDGRNADIKINGKSLTDAISKLEERLNILVPNPELEAEWDELRELGERYRQLEREFDEKSRAWAALKKE